MFILHFLFFLFRAAASHDISPALRAMARDMPPGFSRCAFRAFSADARHKHDTPRGGDSAASWADFLRCRYFQFLDIAPLGFLHTLTPPCPRAPPLRRRKAMAIESFLSDMMPAAGAAAAIARRHTHSCRRTPRHSAARAAERRQLSRFRCRRHIFFHRCRDDDTFWPPMR